MNSMSYGRIAFFVGTLLVTCVCGVVIGVTVAGRMGGQPQSSHPIITEFEEDGEEPTGIIDVNVINPKRDPAFQRTISGPAYVEPYFLDDMFAKVAGPIKSITKKIGDHVA